MGVAIGLLKRSRLQGLIRLSIGFSRVCKGATSISQALLKGTQRLIVLRVFLGC